MKKLLTFLVTSVVLCFALTVDAQARGAGDKIGTIRSQYASINKNITKYRKVKKDASGYSAEGGALEAYFDGASIKKIVVHFYGEMGRTDEEYYYWDDRLIFVFRKESTYNQPLSGEVVSTKENRFYFDNGRMIRWLDEKGRQVPSTRNSYDEKQSENLKTSRELTDLARSKT